MTLTRRSFVVHGVAVGAACWVAPTIVSVPVAWAGSPGSAPPRSPKPPEETTSQPMMGPPLAADIPPQMPFTGQELKKEAVLGAAALGAGAALVGLTHTPKREPLT